MPSSNILLQTKVKRTEDHKTHSELGTISIIRHRDINLHIIRYAPPLELGLHFDHILYSTAFMAFYSRFDPNKRFNRGGEAIRHELKLAVWGNERYGTIVFESGQSHALVKFDVFHLYGFSTRSCWGISRGSKGSKMVTTHFALCFQT